jgi:hypothetical protein
MRRLVCEKCGQSVPLADSFSVRKQQLCAKCAEEVVSEARDLPEGSVVQNTDPTVCVNCGKDAGDTELPTMVSLPVCEECSAFLRNRPFPPWVKGAAALLVAIVIFSLIWNSRFVMAYTEMKGTVAAAHKGDLGRAAALAESAAGRVPESADLRAVADFYAGIALLRDDRPREALQRLKASRKRMPDESGILEFIYHAELGVAFDDKDYDGFLSAATRLLKLKPNDPMALGSVASAYACKFAETGDAGYRGKSLEFLEKAKAADRSGQFAEYEMRIRHRLHTREIIEREEFQKRFPNGWTEPGGEKG